jgi:outer membrane lipoprotein-sorting protein
MQKKVLIKSFLILFVIFFLISPSFAAPTLKEITQKLQEQTAKIQTLEADIQTILSTPLINDGEPTIMESKLYKKGKDKTRTEITTPSAQIMVVNGTTIYAKDVDSGQVVKTEKKYSPDQFDPNSDFLDLERYLKDYELTVQQKAEILQIQGKPKQASKMIKRLTLDLDPQDFQVKKIIIYNLKDQPLFNIALEYESVGGVSVPVHTTADMNSVLGSMKIEMIYKNVKVNQPLDDGLFVLK